MAHFVLDLGKQVASIGVKAAYGEQQEIDGVRIIPVTLAGSAFSGSAEENGAHNGSGGNYNIPVGAYVRRGDDVTFKPNIIALFVLAVPFVMVAGRALARVIRVLKK